MKDKNAEPHLDKLYTDAIEMCHKNMQEIIASEPVSYWAEKLGVSKSLISARWKKDHFPNIPNAIKLLLLSGYSANWLFLGAGPKYMIDVHDPDQNAADEKRRRALTVDLFEMENQLSEEKNKLKELQQYIEVHVAASELIKKAFPNDIFSKSSLEIKDALGKNFFKLYVLPMMTMLQLINQISFKLFETASESINSVDIIKEIILFINTNFERNQFGLMSSLLDLDRLVKDSGINKILSSPGPE